MKEETWYPDVAELYRQETKAIGCIPISARGK